METKVSVSTRADWIHIHKISYRSKHRVTNWTQSDCFEHRETENFMEIKNVALSFYGNIHHVVTGVTWRHQQQYIVHIFYVNIQFNHKAHNIWLNLFISALTGKSYLTIRLKESWHLRQAKNFVSSASLRIRPTSTYISWIEENKNTTKDIH